MLCRTIRAAAAALGYLAASTLNVNTQDSEWSQSLPITCKHDQLPLPLHRVTVHSIYRAEQDTQPFCLALKHTLGLVADELAAVDVCFHLAMAELVAAC